MKKSIINIKSLYFSISLLLLAAIFFSFNACSLHTTNITLYFAKYTETNYYLKPEARKIKITNDMDLYKKVLEELIKGPQNKELYPTLPSSTKVNSVVVKDKLATVDLSRVYIWNYLLYLL